MPITSRFASAAARAYGMFRIAAGAAVDPFFNYVTALLHGDGTNGAQNNTFLDSSTNNFTITRNGNTTQGTFSPFSQTGWSNYFDGSGDYLTAPNNAAFALPADFTVEAWVYFNSNTTSVFCGNINSSGYGDWAFFYNNSAGLRWLTGNGTTVLTATYTMPLNVWTHVAISRSGTDVRFFANGALLTTVTNSSSNTFAGTMYIGSSNDGGLQFPGYMSNLRIVKGTAVYTAAFTPPTVPLTAISGTSLLTCQANRFLDASSNNFAITKAGDTSVQAFSPFNPTTAWSASSNGGSGYFDGSGDYLDVANNNTFDTNSTFTLECWVLNFASTTQAIFARGGGNASSYWNTSDGTQFILYFGGSNTINWQWNNAGSPATINATAPAKNQWTHIAVGYNGTTTRVWVDGVSIGTSTTAYTLPTTRNVVRVGAEAITGATSPFNGYISNLRFVKGTDVYGVGNTTITVPTAPLTAITNTSLLLSATNAGIYDNAAVGDYETVGNAQVSTSVVKYGTGSMAFDGTGDSLVAPSNQGLVLGSGDFTIEMWAYYAGASYSGIQYLIDQRTSEPQIAISFYFNGSNLEFYVNGLARISNAVPAAVQTWQHIALVRYSGTTKIYVNGSATGSSYTDSNVYVAPKTTIGDRYSGSYVLNGYIDDLRITKGVGRYPYNFTPPAAAFPNIGGTVTLTADPYFRNTTLLLPGNGTNGAQNNTFLDSSSNAFTITRNGNTTQGNFSPFSQTGWGNYFDGNGDYLITTSTQVIPTGSFTVEAFVYPTSSSDSYAVAQGTTGNAGRFSLGITSSLWYVQIGTAQVNAGSVALNQWTHLAATFNGTTLTLYVNGTSVGTAATTTNVQNTTLRIGSLGPADWGTFYWTGYISNTRSTNSVVYTSNFTPPTSALTAISGTTFLSCQSNRFIDNSTNAYAITRNGDVSVQAFSPFAPTAAWSASTNGGSGYFDGSGDYLTVPDNAAFDFGSGDFTISAWVYPQGAGAIVDQGGGGSSTDRSFELYMSSASSISNAYISSTGSYQSAYNLTGTTVPNAWNFIEFTRTGGNIYLFVNGVQQSTASANITIYNSTSAVAIGNTSGSAVNPFTGYISNVRILKGTGASSSTVPTAPLTAIANTQLLLSCTNGGIVDATAKNDLETVGNAQISTTQSKFGGSSMYFDGTGDWLAPIAGPNVPFGTGDFTVEFWMYPTSVTSSTVAVVSNRFSAGADTVFICGFDNGASYGIYFHTQNTAVMNTSVSPTVNTWQHVAFARYNGTLRIFLNGISIGTPTSFTSNLSATNAVLVAQDGTRSSPAGNFAGYINDLRITKGIARYTSNFTPPTSAFLTL